MKTRAASALFALFLLAALILPAAAYAESLTLEPVQGAVNSDVKIPAFCQYGEGEYFLYWGDNNQLIKQGNVSKMGCQPITFQVPQSPRGKHMVTLKIGSKSFQKEFTVLGSIGIGTKKGPVGAEVPVQGYGFNPRETGIKIMYDGNAVASGIEATANGSWLYSLKIPASSKGNHPITASGASTPASEAKEQVFTVTPTMNLNPTSGWVGRVVNASGQGFGSAETNIAVLYDDLLVKTNLSADLSGSWQTSFSVPASSKGVHKVDARGSTTALDDVADAQFTVSPGIKVEQASGRLGDVINTGDTLFVNGVGFQENENNIRITFDGLQVVGGIAADAHGSWASQFAVPAAARGEHTVDSFGDATKSGDVSAYTVVITPEVSINPVTGAVGENTLLTGSGFGASQPLTITYDSKKVASEATTDSKGSFSTAFKPPASAAGTHPVTVSDGNGAIGTASFTIESTAPQAPSPLSPEAGTKIGMFENKPIEFKWSAVDDPSGVTYALEMSQKADFSGSVIRKENLDKPDYTLPASEKPQQGEYYWRVRASDRAGNASEWSRSQLLMFSGFDFIWPIVGVIVGLAIIGLVIWRIRAISNKGGWSSS
jgi:hypothetical protein